MNWIFVLATCSLFFLTAQAQQPDIENYLTMLENGQAEPVRAELPSLLSRYGNNPGVLYLQAVLTVDGSAAVRLYHDIVEKFPASEWADDALYKVYKYYTSIELNRTADLKLNELKSKYPNSKYLSTLATGAPPPVDIRTEPPAPAPRETVAVPATIPLTQTESKPEPSASPASAVESSAPTYALQIGAFSTIANASTQKSFFEYHKYPAQIVTKVVGSRQLFVVLVGNYATREEARVKGDELQSAFNVKYMVVTR